MGPSCDPTIYPECASFSTTVTPAPGPDLTLTKTGPLYSVVGSTVTYTLTITNVGSAAVAAGTTFNTADVLPTGAAFVSATAAAPLVAGPVTCTGSPTLTCGLTAGSNGFATGTSATVTMVVTAPSTPSTGTNYASVSIDGTAQPPTPGVACITSNCASLPQTFDPVPTPELTLAKTSYPTTVVNGQIVYTFTVTNVGSGPLAAGTVVPFADTLPSQTTLTGFNDLTGVTGTQCTGTQVLTGCTTTLASALAVGGTATFEMFVTAPPSTGSITNYASISPDGTTAPPTPGPSCTTANCASDAVLVNPVANANLAISKTGPATVTAGAQAAYTISITNQGTAPLSSGATFAVRDRLPAGATLVSTTPGTGITSVPCIGTTSLACVVTLSTSLPVGGVATFTLTMTAPVSSYTNYVSVSTDGTRNAPTAGPACSQSNCANAPTTVNAPALSLAKTGPASGIVGGQATYTLTVTNNGAAAVAAGASLTVLDQLPASATYVSATPGSGIASVLCTGTSLLTCSPVVGAGGLAIGGTATFSVTMTLPAGTSATNYASITPDGITPPTTPGPACNTASCASFITTPLTAPVLALGKTGPATAVPGGRATYSLTISNTGAVAAPGGIPVAMLDQLPAGASFASASAGAGVAAVSCTGSSLVSCGVTLAAGGLAPGGTVVFYITATMPSPFDGAVSNIASVSIDGVTPPVDPATACAGLGRRRRLQCSTCACAGCKTDVYDPNDPAAVLKRKAAAAAAAARRAKVNGQRKKQELLTAVANVTETKLAAVDPALEAKVAAEVNKVRAKEAKKAGRELILFDAVTNKTLTAIGKLKRNKTLPA